MGAAVWLPEVEEVWSFDEDDLESTGLVELEEGEARTRVALDPATHAESFGGEVNVKLLTELEAGRCATSRCGRGSRAPGADSDRAAQLEGRGSLASAVPLRHRTRAHAGRQLARGVRSPRRSARDRLGAAGRQWVELRLLVEPRGRRDGRAVPRAGSGSRLSLLDAMERPVVSANTEGSDARPRPARVHAAASSGRLRG